MSNADDSVFPYSSLPDDVDLLKELIRQQSALVGLYVLESRYYKQQVKELQEKVNKLSGLLCPTN
jgi:hypothetical protein